ncbi:MAG: SGNH/GDSL hydrolase family protein, partial [Calditrichaeota bacterium]
MKALKNQIFILLMLLLPVAFFALLEGSLRLFHLFAPEPLVRVVMKNGQQMYQINTHVARRYFDPHKVTVPGAIPATFAVNKSHRVFRIFCLGGSTTAGFPFDCQVSFPQQLRYMLRQAYPQYHFEVINLGISALNSYTVLDLLPAILDLQPDLILIYMGHNEFY